MQMEMGQTKSAPFCIKWSRSGLNRRPLACHASALPTELRPLLVFYIAASSAEASSSFGEIPTNLFTTSPFLKMMTLGID